MDNHFLVGSVSVPCNVLDCIQIDDGVRTDFWVTSGISIDSRDANGTYLSNSGTGNAYYVLNNVNTSKGGAETDWNDDYCFEFDLIEYTGTIHFQFLQDASHITNVSFDYKNLVGGHKYSIEFRKNEKTITLYQDGTQYGNPFAHTMDDWYRFAFIVGASASLAFKNFKVYPI